jgi:hypothetical protein
MDQPEDEFVLGQIRQHHVLRLGVVCAIRRGIQELNLQLEVWARGNPVQLNYDKEHMLAALEVNRTLQRVCVGYHFLVGISEDDQRRVFRALENIPTLKSLRLQGLPGEDGAIHTRDLLESLPRLVLGLDVLLLHFIFMRDQSEVELLADTVGAHGVSLRNFSLVGIFSRGDENMGFLDPILHAVRKLPQQPTDFMLTSIKNPVNGSSLITVQALRLFLQSAVDFNGEDQRCLHLINLGLGDEHCKAIAELLVKHDGAPEGALGQLRLEGNPAIGHDGCEAILGLLNREHWIGAVSVDNDIWQAKFDLVVEMNRKHGRGEYLRDGVFESQEDWLNCLERLAGVGENDETDDARRLNFLWYTLLEKPEYVSR